MKMAVTCVFIETERVTKSLLISGEYLEENVEHQNEFELI